MQVHMLLLLLLSVMFFLYLRPLLTLLTRTSRTCFSSPGRTPCDGYSSSIQAAVLFSHKREVLEDQQHTGSYPPTLTCDPIAPNTRMRGEMNRCSRSRAENMSWQAAAFKKFLTVIYPRKNSKLRGPFFPKSRVWSWEPAAF